ncbi:MAG: maleylacetoacetate isomerase [Proteobacteria bacterium]|nr:maleylacetoacetate isomerase [Pseudomonadota bacterium]
MFELYDYFRSSACYRVRIALNLKEIPYKQIPIHLVKNEQVTAEYAALNPQKLVPTLQDPSQNIVLTQSLAIIEYLEETKPLPALLPQDPLLKAKVRAFAQIIACDIHPLNNLRVLKYLKHEIEVSDEQKTDWYFHWLRAGFKTIEMLLQQNPIKGVFCFGETPSLADICLIPQVYNALRFDFSFNHYPLIYHIYQHCQKIPAFIKAQPEQQPDALP